MSLDNTTASPRVAHAGTVPSAGPRAEGGSGMAQRVVDR
jgi:hypothetical protein